jgi:adenylosuccinate synthase
VYVDAVEKLGGVPVTAVGVGPGREQTLLRTTSGKE